MHSDTAIAPSLFAAFAEIRCAVSTRHGGVSPHPFGMNLSFNVGDQENFVRQNRVRFFGSLGIAQHRLAVPRQCHSALVRKAEAPGNFEATDGLITDAKDVWLVVSVADCTPVFLFDAKKKAVGAVHAGWRGSASGIVAGAVKQMIAAFESSPSDLHAFIGPSAGPCCYEVGEEVASQFHPDVVHARKGTVFLDLKKENARQLTANGVPERQIETSPHCTICGGQLFHSYRRDRERSGRMMGVIGLKG